MKIPKIFLPEKNLDTKVGRLLETPIHDKKPSDDAPLYETLSYDLADCLKRLSQDNYRRILCLSDENMKSRYKDVKEILETCLIQQPFDLKILDYYGKEIERSDIHSILADYVSDSSLFQVIYAKNETIEKIQEEDFYYDTSAALLSRAFIISI